MGVVVSMVALFRGKGKGSQTVDAKLDVSFSRFSVREGRRV